MSWCVLLTSGKSADSVGPPARAALVHVSKKIAPAFAPESGRGTPEAALHGQERHRLDRMAKPPGRIFDTRLRNGPPLRLTIAAYPYEEEANEAYSSSRGGARGAARGARRAGRGACGRLDSAAVQREQTATCSRHQLDLGAGRRHPR